MDIIIMSIVIVSFNMWCVCVVVVERVHAHVHAWVVTAAITGKEQCHSRLLHYPGLYKHIHKRHHEWTAPIGIVSIYAHPVEHILSNLIPPAVGPLLLGSHLATSWMWFALALMSTTVAHCGYHFPFLPSPEAHDYHHLK